MNSNTPGISLPRHGIFPATPIDWQTIQQKMTQMKDSAFRHGEEIYAVPSSAVREVYPLKGLSPLPCTPPFVLGVINARGHILPVIDLTSLLGLAKQQVSEQS